MIRVKGVHHCEGHPVYGSYDLRADKHGVVSCGTCGAVDLLPEQEALNTADGSTRRLDRFIRYFRRQVRAGLR